MNNPNTAEELRSLIEKLTPEEQVRVAKLALRLASTGRSVTGYAESAPTETEFSSDEDSLAWDAEGWDEFSAEG